METIESMNALLKAQGSRLKIELRGKFLSLKGTLPFGDGFKQQRVSLKLQNTEHSLVKAKDTALRISAA